MKSLDVYENDMNYSYGNYYMAKGDFNKAIEFYNIVLSYNINYVEAHEKLSQCLSNVNRFEEALNSINTYNFKNDSLRSVRKIPALNLSETKQEQDLALHEKLKKEKKIEDSRKSKNFLQYSGALFLIILLFLIVNLTLSLNVPAFVIKAFAFITVITLFEFTLVYMDPLIETYSKGEPLSKLGINVALAAFIFPLHTFIERRMSKSS